MEINGDGSLSRLHDLVKSKFLKINTKNCVIESIERIIRR